jgi:hypothetical protein
MIVDSGTDEHLIKDETLLSTTYSKMYIPELKAANGSNIGTTAIGKINELIDKVIVCPKVEENLLSVTKMLKKGMWVIFAPTDIDLLPDDPQIGGVICDANGKICLTVDRNMRTDVRDYNNDNRKSIHLPFSDSNNDDDEITTEESRIYHMKSTTINKVYGLPVSFPVEDLVMFMHCAGHLSMEDMLCAAETCLNYPLTPDQIRKHFPVQCAVCIKGKLRMRKNSTKVDTKLVRFEDEVLSKVEESKPSVPQVHELFKANKRGSLQPRNLVVGAQLGMDTFGPILNSSAIVLTDKASGYTWTKILDKDGKRQIPQMIQLGINHYQRFGHHTTEYGKPIVEVRTDSDQVFKSEAAKKVFRDNGIIVEYSPPDQHALNGLAESTNQVLANMVTCCYAQARHVPEQLWPYCWLLCGKYRNLKKSRIPGSQKTRVEEFTGIQVDFAKNQYIPFGTVVEYYVGKSSRTWKFGEKSYTGVFLDTSDTTAGAIKVFSFTTGKVVERISYRILMHVPNAWTLISPSYFIFNGPDDELQALKHLEDEEVGAAEEDNDRYRNIPLIPIYNNTINNSNSSNTSGISNSNTSINTSDNRSSSISSDNITAVSGSMMSSNSSKSSSSNGSNSGISSNRSNSNSSSKSIITSNSSSIPSGKITKISAPTVTMSSSSNTPSQPTAPTPHSTPTPTSASSPSQPATQSSSSSSVQPTDIEETTPTADESMVLTTRRKRRKTRRVSSLSEQDSELCRKIQLVNSLSKSNKKRKQKSKKKRKKRVHNIDEMEGGDNPTMEQAKRRSDWPLFQAAIDAETEQLDEDGTFDYITDKEVKASIINILGSMFVLQIKRHADGTIDKYKARLVALGNQQTEDQYAAVKSPTARSATVKLLIAIQAKLPNAVSVVMDVKGAYLKSKVDPSDRNLIVRLPNKKYVRLKKYLYGLKQAGLKWNQLLTQTLVAHGYKQSLHDPCLFTKHQKKDFTYIVVHVDDLYVVSSNQKGVKKLHELLTTAFGTITSSSNSVLNYLGIEIRKRSDGSIFLSQPGYLDRILSRVGVKPHEISDLPYTETTEEESSEPCDKTLYLEHVGMLNYLGTLTRPDILYGLSRCAQRCSAPTVGDLCKVRKIFKYLNKHRDLGLTFRPSKDIQLRCWVDASHTHYTEDSKAHYGYAFTIGEEDSVFYARSAKMKIVTPAGSSESEYVALYEAATEVIFLRNILEEMGFAQFEPTIIYEDNKSTIAMVHGGGAIHKRKHIAVKYHYTQELVKNNIVQVIHCESEEMIADILTKAVSKSVLEYLRDLMLQP